MCDNDLADLEKQSYRESMQDGSNVLAQGMLLFSFSLLIWSQIMPLQTEMILYFSGALMFILAFLLPKRLLEGYVYPRTGYVKHRMPSPLWQAVLLLPVFLGFVVMIALLVLLYGISFNVNLIYRFTPLYLGLVMLPQSTMSVKKTGNRMYFLQGVLMSITGFVFVVLDFGVPLLGLVLYMFLCGAIIALVGLVKLFRFIKKYPVLELPEGDTPEQRKSHFY